MACGRPRWSCSATRGFLELSLGEPADGAFDEVRAGVEASGLREPALFRWQADAIEAYVVAGRGDDARAVAAALDRARPWVRSVAARCDALVGAGGDAAAGDAGGQPFERGAAPARARHPRAARDASGARRRTACRRRWAPSRRSARRSGPRRRGPSSRASAGALPPTAR